MKHFLPILIIILSFPSFGSECLYKGKINKLSTYEKGQGRATMALFDDGSVIIANNHMDATLLSTAFIKNSVVCVSSGSISDALSDEGELVKVISPKQMFLARSNPKT